MAAGKSSQSNAMLYTVITFVGLFLLSTVLAVVFYVKFEDERTLRVKDKQKALELASVGEYSNIVKTVGQVKGKSYIKAMQDYLDTLYSAITGEAMDGSAVVKVADAVERINQTMEVLADDASGAFGIDGIDLLGTIKKLKAEIDNAKTRIDDIQKEIEKQGEDYAVNMAEYDETAKKLIRDKGQALAEAARIQTTYEALKNDMDQSTAQQVKTWQDRYETEQARRKEKEVELAGLQTKLDETLEQLNDSVATLEKIKPRPDAEVVAFLPDAKVVSVDLDTNVVYLDLGQKDHVYKGLTFSIYDKSAPIPEDGKGKAEVEVFQINENVVAARIVSSSAKNPPVQDDIAVNLIWDKKTSNSFVVVGDFDIDGDGRTDRDGGEKVTNLIESWGGRVVQDVTINTDFIIIGDEPASIAAPNADDMAVDPDAEQKYQDSQDRIDRYYEAFDKADTFSVPKFNTKRFLILTGYDTTARKSTPKR